MVVDQSGAQAGKGGAQTCEKDHFYAFPGRLEGEALDAVITCTIIVYPPKTYCIQMHTQVYAVIQVIKWLLRAGCQIHKDL